MYLHVYIQFSHALYKQKTQFIHFASVCMSERGERDLRGEKEEQKYTYLYNFLYFIQIETQFIHCASVCISEKDEGGKRDLGEWRARSGRGREGNKNICIYTFFSILYN